MRNITDLQTHSGSQGHALYSVTHVGGGIAAYRIPSAEHVIEAIGQQAYPASAGYAGSPGAAIVQMAGDSVLFGTGLRNGAGAAIRLGSQGDFLNSTASNASSVLPQDMIQLGQFRTPQGSFLYSARDGQTAFDVWRVADNGSISHVTRAVLPLGDGAQGTEIDAMHVATLGDRSFILAASGMGNYVSVQMIYADGSLGTAQMLWSWNGLGMDQPSHLGSVTVSGVTYVVIAASQSSSLTVMRLTYTGELIPVDHIVDERTTRFSGATAMDTLQLGGRAFVFVGGGDDGISVFTVLPDGKLLHVATLADADDRSLADVSAISTMVIDGKIAVFVSSKTERGISQFVFEPGDIGLTRVVGSGVQDGTAGSDMMLASAGTTEMRGGAGDDILMSGTAPVTMTGGDGADVFAVTEVNGRITISDFELGVDRLDMSALGMIRSINQLVFVPQAFGIKIFYGNSVIFLMTKNNTTLQANSFGNELFAVSHYAPPNMRTIIHGTAANDSLTASRNGSNIFGYAGNDLLLGGLGNDLLNGGSGNDTLRASAGNDYLYGYDGNDLLQGGAGNDRLWGGSGDDQLWGGSGDDLMTGEAGNDRMWGEDGNDTMSDLLGSNTLSGGNGNDLMRIGDTAGRMNGDAGNDTLISGRGNDTLTGGAGNDSITSGAGNDQLWGGSGDDTLYGEAGDDLLMGEDGNDTLIDLWGRNTLYGGNGNDYLRHGDTATRLYGEAGNDTIISGAGNDLLVGDTGDDSMSGGGGMDTLLGGSGNDYLSGGAGDDSIDGGSENDRAFGGDGNDIIWGGPGDDTLSGDAGHDTLWGGDGADMLYGGIDHDLLYGGAGNDTLSGGDGHDSLDGGSGNDVLYGGPGHDLLIGNAGDDLLYGESGNNTLRGGSGNDTLWGDSGADYLTGEDGNDVLYGMRGADTLYGGAGDDLLNGGEGDDELSAGDGNDSLLGEAGNDTLRGDAGNDTLSGGAGNDRLEGGDGNDRLEGGAGLDTLVGGAGADTFVFTSADNFRSGTDSITDFQTGVDRIDLSGLSLTYIGDSAFSGAGQVRTDMSQAGMARLMVDLDGDGAADLTVELGPISSFSGSDLLL